MLLIGRRSKTVFRDPCTCPTRALGTLGSLSGSATPFSNHHQSTGFPLRDNSTLSLTHALPLHHPTPTQTPVHLLCARLAWLSDLCRVWTQTTKRLPVRPDSGLVETAGFMMAPHAANRKVTVYPSHKVITSVFLECLVSMGNISCLFALLSVSHDI